MYLGLVVAVFPYQHFGLKKSICASNQYHGLHLLVAGSLDGECSLGRAPERL